MLELIFSAQDTGMIFIIITEFTFITGRYFPSIVQFCGYAGVGFNAEAVKLLAVDAVGCAVCQSNVGVVVRIHQVISHGDTSFRTDEHTVVESKISAGFNAAEDFPVLVIIRHAVRSNTVNKPVGRFVLAISRESMGFYVNIVAISVNIGIGIRISDTGLGVFVNGFMNTHCNAGRVGIKSSGL